MDPFLNFTMEAGTFGHHNRSEAVAKLKNTDEASSAQRVHQVLRGIFPKAATIRNRYTYLQDKPWLLPVAWGDRLIRNRNKLDRRVREIQDILETEDEEIRHLQEMMKQIGL